MTQRDSPACLTVRDVDAIATWVSRDGDGAYTCIAYDGTLYKRVKLYRDKPDPVVDAHYGVVTVGLWADDHHPLLVGEYDETEWAKIDALFPDLPMRPIGGGQQGDGDEYA